MDNMTKKISVLYRIIDVYADIIDEYKELIRKSHAEEELEILEIEKKLNKIAALRESVGCAP